MKKKESGQVLLIVIMLVAIILTIVLTITFTSRTDIQLTKLEEENQKTLAAAEAGIEAALQEKSNVDLSTLGNLNQTIKSGAAQYSTSSSDVFESPSLQKDDSYTFYLAPYSNGSWTGPSQTQPVTICFGGNSVQSALDIALVKDAASNPNLRRYAVSADPASQIVNSAVALTGASLPAICTNNGYSYGFTQISGAHVGTDSKLLVVRVLFGSTKILISQAGLPAQGQFIFSTATSKTGVTKKIRLLMSFPQIPSEFFATSF